MSFKRIGQDNYVKDETTYQDTINEDKDKVLELLKDYVRIPYEFCEHLVLGAKIKYISNEGYFRTGGILTKNGFPNYIVLLNPYKKITWSVNLKKIIFLWRICEKLKRKKKIRITYTNYIMRECLLLKINKTMVQTQIKNN